MVWKEAGRIIELLTIAVRRSIIETVEIVRPLTLISEAGHDRRKMVGRHSIRYNRRATRSLRRCSISLIVVPLFPLLHSQGTS